MFWYRADSLQVKRNLISSITNFEYKLSYELRIDLTLMKLSIIRKTCSLRI